MGIYSRSEDRDAHIYASETLETLLGGLWIAKGITSANLYSMMDIFCSFSKTFELQLHGGSLIKRDDSQLQPGCYFVVTDGYVTVTDEVPLLRAILPKSPKPIKPFRNAIRQRDQGCVLSGRRALMKGSWTGFDAAHIFPLAYEGYWNDCGFSDLITAPPATKSDSAINSPQNGILLSASEHHFFAAYDVSINPDDNYKVVCFSPNTVPYGLAGRHLERKFLDDPLRPPDELLRWHFRQAVLVNMKGDGEPFFDIFSES
ncbi:hypothetical protein B9Z19DRAFT_1007705 [Tuber borchii]|uniref:Uncharacterized protein n=1 Tax=Tuber borchii TaxID=42251 RepID=A0A2T6ZBH5_TUBBO|nr:hypothetical protein B9Z19DRAFT_1007705 [Tuber borchii]